MNIEQIEHELTLVRGKQVIVILPLQGTISITYQGVLTVTTCENTKGVGFSVIHPIYPQAFIFYGNDVLKFEKISVDLVGKVDKIIRLKSPHEFNEKYQPYTV